jgi:hypothetical protein
MVTIHRERGFEVLIHKADHPPPHVHVLYGDEELLINLGSGEGLPSVRTNHGMRLPNVRRVVRIVERHLDQLRAAWEEIHGG